MKEWFWLLLIGSALVLLLAGIGFVARGASLASYRFWAPQEQAARREVYEQSPSFVHGKRQMLVRLHSQWATAEGAGKDVLCSTARHEASTLDPTLLPENLADWSCIR